MNAPASSDFLLSRPGLCSVVNRGSGLTPFTSLAALPLYMRIAPHLYL